MFRNILFTIGIIGISTSGLAQGDFAHCGKIVEEQSKIKSPMADLDRLEAMRQLANDLQILKDALIQGHQKLPKSYLGTCYAKKRELLDTHIEVASASTKSAAEFSKIMGQYSMLVNRPDRALTAFLEAARRDPQDLNSRYLAYNLWIAQETEKILAQKDESHKKTLYENFIRDSDKIVMPILNSATASIDMKVAVYNLRSHALLDGFKDLKAAAQDWRAMLKLNPKDTVTAKKYSDFAMFNKDYAEAVSALGVLIEQDANNLQAHLHLVRALEAIKDYKSGLMFSKKAVQRFPKNVELRAFYARCLAEQGLWTDADVGSQMAVKMAPNNLNAQKARSMVLERQGDEYVKSKLVGPALQAYSQAFRFDSKRQSLREKMAALMFDERNKAPEDRSTAAVKDYAQIANLLAPLIENDQLGREYCQIMITAARRANSSKLGSKACDYHDQELGGLLSPAIVIDCAGLYKNSGQKQKAQDLLTKAVTNPNFGASRSELNEALINTAR